jgi:malate/lactate dehydrogenase
MQEDVDPQKVEEEKSRINAEIAEIVDDSLTRIKNVTNFINLAQELSNKKETSLVIKVGQAGEERIDQLRKELEERELLQKSIKELEDKVLLQKVKNLFKKYFYFDFR